MSIQPNTAPYPIGIPGTPWGSAEKTLWLSRQRFRRSYADEVVARLQADLPTSAECFQYGTLAYTHLGLGSYPLYAVRSRSWNSDRPTVLVTGGVHGYETSGVQGALQWLKQDFDRHATAVNLLLLPCISPWGYETINRWNPEALDPNRQFKQHSPAQESALAMACGMSTCTKPPTPTTASSARPRPRATASPLICTTSLTASIWSAMSSGPRRSSSAR